MTHTEKITKIRSDFERLYVNLGDVKDKSSTKFQFKYNGDTPIEGLEKTCGCTADLVYNPNTKIISGTLNLNENPNNINQPEKFKDFEKNIRVYFEPNVPSHTVTNYIRKTNTNKIIVNLKLKGTLEYLPVPNAPVKL